MRKESPMQSTIGPKANPFFGLTRIEQKDSNVVYFVLEFRIKIAKIRHRSNCTAHMQICNALHIIILISFDQQHYKDNYS